MAGAVDRLNSRTDSNAGHICCSISITIRHFELHHTVSLDHVVRKCSGRNYIGDRDHKRVRILLDSLVKRLCDIGNNYMYPS